MTTGEKMKENSHPILTLISRTFWCVEAGKRCQLCSKSATARNYSVRSRQLFLTRAKLTLTQRYIDKLWNWAHSEKLFFFCHIIVIVTSFRPVCKKGESPMPRSFLHRLQRTGPCSNDRKVKKRKQFLILMVFVGLGTVSARSHLSMRWRTVLTSSTGSKRCRNSSFLGRSHLAGRYVIEIASRINNNKNNNMWLRCRSGQLVTTFTALSTKRRRTGDKGK